jgi:lysine N6-hydroxylase
VSPVHVDCLGIGAGPANLSVAALLHTQPQVASLFVDQQKSFGWHDNQQFPDATLQVSMHKDLVTLADPSSKFSFLSYLHAQGRIYHFLNARFDAVHRLEFRDYLRWVADQLDNVVFDERVVELSFQDNFIVRTNKRTITADNVSIAVGTQPWLPEISSAQPGADQYHVSEMFERPRALAGKRVCVIGGGQSGAETFLNLISRSPAESPYRVNWISRRPNFLPIDDSSFTNDFYMPSHSDYFFGLSRADRLAFNEAHVLTSDGVSESTLRQIYQRIYLHRFVGGQSDLIGLYPNREVRRLDRGAAGQWVLGMANANHDVLERVEADVLIWATGFRQRPMPFLDPIAHRMQREGEEYLIDSDFAVRWDGPENRSIFMHNAAPNQRGLADRNLSLVAWRSQRIIKRMLGLKGTDQLPSFIDWSMTEGSVVLDGAHE